MQTSLNNIFFKVFIFCILILGAISCNSRPNDVLSQSDMENVLTDIHLLEGTLRSKNILSTDTSQIYYNSIFAKYKVTREQFDSSLVWYTKHPKIFKNIYTRITERLTQLDADVKDNKYHLNYLEELQSKKEEVWEKMVNYHFTKDSARTTLDFEISKPDFLYGDRYILSFLQQISPADSSINPYVVLRINYLDSNVDSVYTVSHSDNVVRRFTLSLSAKRPIPIRSITGRLLGSTKYKGEFQAKVDSISLKRIYNPQAQDSLKTLVNKAQNTQEESIK